VVFAVQPPIPVKILTIQEGAGYCHPINILNLKASMRPEIAGYSIELLPII